jgi:hypothetical protein
MQIISNNARQYKRPFSIGSVLNYCLIFLIAFSAIARPSVAFSASVAEIKSAGHNSFIVTSDKDSHASFPFTQPVTSESTDNETESGDENESEDDINNPCNHLFWKSQVEYKFNAQANNSTFSQLKATAHNRSTVSLFILHHSWKSFLI